MTEARSVIRKAGSKHQADQLPPGGALSTGGSNSRL